MQSQHFFMPTLQLNLTEFSQSIAKEQEETPRLMSSTRRTSDRKRSTLLKQNIEGIKQRATTRTTKMTTTNITPKIMLSTAALLLLAALGQLIQSSQAARLPDIYWNSSNPIFRIDNTDHIFDVNRKGNDHDQVDLVCPQQQQQHQSDGTSNNKTATDERYIIYSVSKEEYDTCRLAGPSSGVGQATNNGGQQPRVVAVCDQPQAGKPQRPPFTVTFRSFTPQPNGLEFKPGQDYYFITALIGHQHDPAKRFSPCRELNMKVIFKVCCKAPNANGIASSPSQSSSSPAPVRTKQSTTRRPVASPVVTLRPSLVSSSAKTPASADFGSAFTVLPIEVLQPDQPAAPASNGAEPTITSTQAPPQLVSQVVDSERNDILLNEQPSTFNGINRLPQAPRAKQQASTGAVPPPSFLPFDPRAAPEVLRADYGRWAPTPLPPRLTASPASSSLGRAPPQQPASFAQANEPAPWRLPPLPRPPLQRQALSIQQSSDQQQQQQQQQYPRGAQSRMSLYPHAVWSTTYNDQQQQQQSTGPVRDLITVQDQQQGGSATSVQGAPTFALALLVPLLALAILLALGLERRLR